MRCPFCQGPMSAGRTDISRTTLGEVTDLVTGDFTCMPHYLYFYPEGGGDSVCLDHARRAFHCGRCEAFVIAGTKAKPEGWKDREQERRTQPSAEGSSKANLSSCPACGAAIGSEHARRPGCDIAVR